MRASLANRYGDGGLGRGTGTGDWDGDLDGGLEQERLDGLRNYRDLGKIPQRVRGTATATGFRVFCQSHYRKTS